MDFKVMVIYQLGISGTAVGYAATSQLLEFSSEADAEKALKAVRKSHQSAVDSKVISFIRFYETSK